MNRRTAWLLIGVVFVLTIALLVALELYFRSGLLTYLVILYVIVLVLFVYIRRISNKKQAGSVIPST
jgi:uncharacterized membrane protein